MNDGFLNYMVCSLNSCIYMRIFLKTLIKKKAICFFLNRFFIYNTVPPCSLLTVGHNRGQLSGPFSFRSPCIPHTRRWRRFDFISLFLKMSTLSKNKLIPRDFFIKCNKNLLFFFLNVKDGQQRAHWTTNLLCRFFTLYGSYFPAVLKWTWRPLTK